MIFTLGEYILDIDVEKTKDFYRDYVYECNCDACVNYKLAATDTFPDVSKLFDQFGLDISKPSEVYDMDSENNILFCGGWYHISGKIIKDTASKSNEDMCLLNDNFRIGFSTECTLLEKNFPTPCFQMYIYAHLPWKLDKENGLEK